MRKSLFRAFLFLTWLWTIPPSVNALSYTPASMISLTGANNEVFFDVGDDVYTAGTSVSGPTLETTTRTFSGAFYLSGAGWVDFSTGSYHVDLDCGAQSLSSLSTPCTLSGMAYSETLGDVVFDRRVSYDPSQGVLFGTAATFAGEYSFSGIFLPLLPALFTEGISSVANHITTLTLSGGSRRYGDGTWQVYFDESTTSDSTSYSLSTLPSVDLSLAALYYVRIIDPSGSETRFDYSVTAGLPTPSLLAGPYHHESFCSAHPSSLSLCPDGSLLHATKLAGSSSPRVANGADAYALSLSLRDTYGNEVTSGQIKIIYQDSLRTLQVGSEYGNIWADSCVFGTCGLITGGALLNFYDGSPSSAFLPTFGGITYSLAAIAPTSPTDTVSLSGVIYRDSVGVDHDITDASWKGGLSFSPWYQTSLAGTPFIVGSDTHFTTTFSPVDATPPPAQATGIYHIDIGSNTLTSYKNYTSPYSCTKDVSAIGSTECNWTMVPVDTSIISTDTLSFTGNYSPAGGYHPPPETVSYRSYIRYMTGGIAVLYPSGGGTLGVSTPGKEYMKIYGTENLEGSLAAIAGDKTGNIWNTLRKNIALLSRARASYADVDYEIYTGDKSLTDADFSSKRAIVVIGGDVTLTSDISPREHPAAIIVLSDAGGDGGDITIDPSVRDMDISLFAEKSVKSSGDNQLSIHGSIISHNTVSSSKCPYYVSGVCNPDEYNLEKIRADYTALSDKTGHTAMNQRALDNPSISLVIEYDGRVLTDPPPVLIEN